MNGSIRPAHEDDAGAIREVLAEAFPSEEEAGLVEAVRRDGDSLIELVHIGGDGAIDGFIMLSRLSLLADGSTQPAAGLAPVAVLPGRQKAGIGGALVRSALDEAKARGLMMVFVLGSPKYYGRFGFSTTCARPFISPYAGEYFQAIVLDDGFALPKTGIADYAPAFAALGGE